MGVPGSGLAQDRSQVTIDIMEQAFSGIFERGDRESVSQNAQPLALLTSLGNNTCATRPPCVHHSWHLHSWLIGTGLSIPIDRIVSFSWQWYRNITGNGKLDWQVSSI